MAFDIDALDRRMAAASLFVASLKNGDIVVPDSTVSQAAEVSQALQQYGKQLAMIRRKAGEADHADNYLRQPNVAYLLGQMEDLAAAVLKEQKIFIDAVDDGLVDIVSRDELQQSRSATVLN